jgi:uncharacterized surface protein with fasciclin (FAS1) repeats
MKILRFITIIYASLLMVNSAQADHHKQTMWDVIVNDNRFTTFATLVEEAGLIELFDERAKFPATVYIPTNFGFSTMPQAMSSAFRFAVNKDILVKLIRSHYFLGTYQNPAEGSEFVTVNIDGNKVKIAQDKDLFVQPSRQDARLTEDQQERFNITSCCLRTMKETAAFLNSVVFE